MEFILDANTLIYLVKLNLHEEFIKLVNKGKIIIDSSVYGEVVTKGIENNYPYAPVAKKFLQRHQISVIPIDISEDLHKFLDAGETSCALLVLHKKSNRICITSDINALKKFEKFDIPAVQLDAFYFYLLLESRISEDDFFAILYELERIYAIKPERIHLFSDFLKQQNRTNQKRRNNYE